jgi:hypothetical protein
MRRFIINQHKCAGNITLGMLAGHIPQKKGEGFIAAIKFLSVVPL